MTATQRGLAIGFALLVLLAGCSGGSGEGSVTPTPTTSETGEAQPTSASAMDSDETGPQSVTYRLETENGTQTVVVYPSNNTYRYTVRTHVNVSDNGSGFMSPRNQTEFQLGIFCEAFQEVTYNYTEYANTSDERAQTASEQSWTRQVGDSEPETIGELPAEVLTQNQPAMVRVEAYSQDGSTKLGYCTIPDKNTINTTILVDEES